MMPYTDSLLFVGVGKIQRKMINMIEKYNDDTLNMNKLPRMRTIPKAYDEIKKLDNNTSFTLRALRRMCTNGDIPTVKVGNKTLINLDMLIHILSCDNKETVCVL